MGTECGDGCRVNVAVRVMSCVCGRLVSPKALEQVFGLRRHQRTNKVGDDSGSDLVGDGVFVEEDAVGSWRSRAAADLGCLFLQVGGR